MFVRITRTKIEELTPLEYEEEWTVVQYCKTVIYASHIFVSAFQASASSTRYSRPLPSPLTHRKRKKMNR